MAGRRAWILKVAAIVGDLAVAATALAGSVQSPSPYWFQDTYTSLSSVNATATTTAALNTSGTGTVRLPYAPLGVAFNPAGTYVLVASEGGVYAYVFDGQGVVPVTNWSLGSLPATGVAWVDRGTAFAVTTPSEVALYGLSVSSAGYDATLVAKASTSSVIGAAPGPAALPGAVLAATPTGATLYESQGASLAALSGGPTGLTDNLGVAATADGSIAATWQSGAVQLWTWDGSAYESATAWAPPAPPSADGPIVSVAFFPKGDGYWVLTRQGQLLAYSFGATGLSALPGYSRSVPASSALPAALGSGWGGVSVGVLYPTGWQYEDLGAGNTFGEDPAKSLSRQSWPVYAASAVLQSVVLPVGHTVDELRVEDANCSAGETPPNCTDQAVVPTGTSVAYQLSTDGCSTWTAAPLFTNVTVPAGSELCYRLTLTTTDPAETPVVDVTNLYEIATETVVESSGGPSELCLGSGC